MKDAVSSRIQTNSIVVTSTVIVPLAPDGQRFHENQVWENGAGAARSAQASGNTDRDWRCRGLDDMIASADHVVDLGPGAGTAGGEVVFEQPPGATREGTLDDEEPTSIRRLEREAVEDQGECAADPLESGRPLEVLSDAGYWQLEAIILMLSTFSLGAALAAAAAGASVAPFACSTVPVISTLWPTCGVSLASSPSSRYSLAIAAGGFAAPAVPAVAEGLIDALFSMNFVAFSDAAPAAPLVAVGPGSALATHPDTVIAFAAPPCDGFCGAGGSCARSPTLTPTAMAAHVPDQILAFIAPPV
jgi:hypothetical protein